MNDDQIQVPVTLTKQEAADVEGKARTQGVSTSDFLGYCVRAMSFGINYAIRCLPSQGQTGPRSED